jgi:hypothetical protein
MFEMLNFHGLSLWWMNKGNALKVKFILGTKKLGNRKKLITIIDLTQKIRS